MWILLFNERSKHVARNIQDIFSINKISIVLTSGLCIPLELYYSCCDSKSGPVCFVSSCSTRHHLNQRETQILTHMHKRHASTAQLTEYNSIYKPLIRFEERTKVRTVQEFSLRADSDGFFLSTSIFSSILFNMCDQLTQKYYACYVYQCHSPVAPKSEAVSRCISAQLVGYDATEK